jgi:tetratricopeptide (TPR) repeat protein
MSYLHLSGAFGKLHRPEEALKTLEKMRDYCIQSRDNYGLVLALDRLHLFYARLVNLQKAKALRRQRFEALASFESTPPYLKMLVLGGMGFARSLSGRLYKIEKQLGEALDIAVRLEVLNQIGISRDLAYVLGMSGKYYEADHYFAKSLTAIEKLSAVDVRKFEQAINDGFRGAILKRRGELKSAKEKLLSCLKAKTEVRYEYRIPELYMWLGELHEQTFEADRQKSATELQIAESYYTHCIAHVRSNPILIGRYFECAALTGLVRVKHAQGGHAAIPPLLVEAEQIAQQYEYNDHLASLRLTHGHVGQISNFSNESNLTYYQHALIYALRYNRFLLDEVLSGRPQGMLLRPIIPHCLERGEEGQQMLIALRDWWKTGVNDIGKPRPDTISPIPEGVPLLEAERIAREREPGDGSPQKTVTEQIEMALSSKGAS